MRGSSSAREPRSSLADVHREFVHHIMEEQREDKVDEQDDRTESGQQGEEWRVAENQTNCPSTSCLRWTSYSVRCWILS